MYDPQFEHDSCGVGFVCNINGKASNEIVRQGLRILVNLSHRGATGADPLTGDGAGILIQMPHRFFSETMKARTVTLPQPGSYGSGLVFLPSNDAERVKCKKIIQDTIVEEGQSVIAWRPVPTDDSHLGKTAKNTKPAIEQIFIGRGANIPEQLAFERKLYVIRRRIENAVRAAQLRQKSCFYIPSLSSRTFIYKGLLTPAQVENFFPDLQDPNIESAIGLVHSRYSTNTFPTWDLAQPFRFLAHNGEINTLRGNINWMQAKEGLLKSDSFGGDIEKLKHIVVTGGSDSAMLDNVFELLTLSGRSLAHAMMMLIPSAWEHDGGMDEPVRDFYKYHACLMEPWDGPAAVAFTDGTRIGAVLDRNGLRPARYIVTKNGLVVMASEAGVLDIKPAEIITSGRLKPGRIFFIDTAAGSIIHDRELKNELASAHDYGRWLKDNMLELDDLPVATAAKHDENEQLTTGMITFGYTREDGKIILKHMAETAQEPVGSMGNDTPPAVLSHKPHLLYNYFKQLFAQVTNPAIDSIREELVMSLESFIGPRKNVLDATPGHCRRLHIKQPVLSNEELEKIRHIKHENLKSKTISILCKAGDKNDFMQALERICAEAEEAISQGYAFIILSDRGSDKDNAALPALLATGTVHQYLVKKAMRAQIAIIVESAEPREVHHFALLFGYGAGCVNPYLAFEAVRSLAREKTIECDEETAVYNYIKAVDKGILKIMSKMGISALESYRGAQIFEAVGLGDEVVERSFTGTVSRIGGIGFDTIAEETMRRHAQAYHNISEEPLLEPGGLYQWRRDGEMHLWNPESIAALQDAARKGNEKRYREFASLINDQSKNPTTLRSLLTFTKTNPIPISEVESASEILKRFATGAMSFGSISRGAHETIALAMNRIGGKSNTGEGGEDPARFSPLPNGDSRRSAIKQVASGRFGVTTNYLVNADEIQIKIAQGAKPGEGGQLPGHKVSAIIARTRYTTQGVTLISPPPHHDIYSIEDLAQLIFDLKNANPRARISVKLVSETGVGTVAAGVAKGHADMILISGGDGGTGASPLSSIKHAGLPWEMGLSETHQTLVLNDLRSRVRLQTDGQMRTGRDVAIAALLGAEEYGFCTAILIVLGCVMLRHCHLNTCSVGVATQDEVLEKRFSGKPEYIINYFTFVVQELREIMAQLGFRKIEDMIGRTDCLAINKELLPWKAKNIDFSRLLYKPAAPWGVGVHKTMEQDHGIANVLDHTLIERAKPALESRKDVCMELPINNTNRTTGAMLSGEVCRRYGEEGLTQDTICCTFKGVAGQSFGAFLAKGITFKLVGMANDYVGKGMSGGKIIIYPDTTSAYEPGENILLGNTTFYGAIAGEAYLKGVAGERFCIRNSGLNAVVEGVGDHACEYMTGGRIVILGETGRNFGAGMSGGIAYVLDEDGTFKTKCNLAMVELEKLDKDDAFTVRLLLENHYRATASNRAKIILDSFADYEQQFVKVMPMEYKRILELKKIEEKMHLGEVADG